jgi:hypothetical protein
MAARMANHRAESDRGVSLTVERLSTSEYVTGTYPLFRDRGSDGTGRLVLDYVQKNQAHIRKVERYPDVRRRSVIELGERCNYLADHARQVARVALAIFDATRKDHALGDREREWLEYAALLHDVGVHISYERHHKHSYYLIKHGDLRGFEPEEIEMIALVARYHRQNEPKKSHEGFSALGRNERRIVRTLAAMVRLAEALDRSHTQVVSRVHVDRREDTLTIRLQGKDDNELELWAARRQATELAAQLNKEIHIERGPGRPPTRPVEKKDTIANAGHAHDASRLPGPPVRRRRHRRLRQDHAAGPARKVADRQRAPGVRH